MKSVAIETISSRRDEILRALASGEVLMVTDGGAWVAELRPQRNSLPKPSPDDPIYRIAELAKDSTDPGGLTNEEMDRLIYDP